LLFAKESKRLLSFQEIVEMFQRGENLFDITIEKWERIRRSLAEAKDRRDMIPILENARTGGAFCLEYQNNCPLCPIQKWCRPPEGRYQNIMRFLYMFATSGELYFKEQAEREIDRFLNEMRKFKEELHQRLN